jgi:uncharacterized membrane-anchored protein YhcB (DUF1043 family)
MNIWKISTIGLVVALGVVVGGDVVRTAHAQQANMEAAIAKLQEAKGALQRAAEDKGGHRAKAVALTEQAIEEARQGVTAGGRK